MNKKELAEQMALSYWGYGPNYSLSDLSESKRELIKDTVKLMLDYSAAIIEAMGKPEANWKQLRDKFFKECTETYEAGKGLNVLRRVSYNIAPHDLFEWFKKELQSIEAMGVQPGMRWVKASERLPEVGGFYFVKIGKLKDKTCWTRNKIVERIGEGDGGFEIEWLEEAIEPKGESNDEWIRKERNKIRAANGASTIGNEHDSEPKGE